MARLHCSNQRVHFTITNCYTSEQLVLVQSGAKPTTNTLGVHTRSAIPMLTQQIFLGMTMPELVVAYVPTSTGHWEREEDEGCVAQQVGVSMNIYYYLGSSYEGAAAHVEDAAIATHCIDRTVYSLFQRHSE